MRFREYINEAGFPTAPPAQKKAVEELKKKGFKIVMWDADFVGMTDKKKNPVEVYPDGTVKYPKRLGEEKKYKVEIKGVTHDWMSLDDAGVDPKGKRYSQKEAENKIKKAIKAGRNSTHIRMIPEAIGALPTQIIRTATFSDYFRGHGSAVALLSWEMKGAKGGDDKVYYNMIENIAAHDIRKIKHLITYTDSGYEVNSIGNFGKIESYMVELYLWKYEEGLKKELKKMKFKIYENYDE